MVDVSIYTIFFDENTYYCSYGSSWIYVLHSVVGSIALCEVVRRISTINLTPRLPTYGV